MRMVKNGLLSEPGDRAMNRLICAADAVSPQLRRFGMPPRPASDPEVFAYKEILLMAKGQNRSNKEVRKPKKDKKPVSATAGPAPMQIGTNSPMNKPKK